MKSLDLKKIKKLNRKTGEYADLAKKALEEIRDSSPEKTISLEFAIAFEKYTDALLNMVVARGEIIDILFDCVESEAMEQREENMSMRS